MWSIDRVVRNSKGAQKDGVIEVLGTYTMTDGDYSASYPMVAIFTPDKSKEGYVAWADLTQEIVEGWMDEYCNIEEVKASLTAQIDEQKGKTEGLPW
tara:strand:- start:789 stop:1079 length:291 start_codon:yes stop_codon:yes gene_type:complete